MCSTQRMIAELMQGIGERGVLPNCDGVLSGYMGSAEIGAAMLDAVAQVKRANPQARYCCDPVIGDVGRGVFVRPGVAEFMRDKAVPAADIVTPNHFELDHLTGRTTTNACRRAGGGRRRCARWARSIVLVTSLLTDETPDDAIDLIACDDRAATACARRSCRSRSTARAMPSRRCSSRTTCATGSAAEALSRAAVVGVRHPQAHRGGRFARNPADRGAGRTGQPSREFLARVRSD